MIEARAAITDGFGKFRIDTVEVEPPGVDEVLVEIRAAGVCHTDYDFMNREVVRVLGHEGGAHETAAEMVAAGYVPPMVIAMPSDGLWA